MNKISRKEAIISGLKKFFTGAPCKHGHISERNSSDGKCIECVRAQSRKYQSLNKDKNAERGAKWRAENKGRQKAYFKKRYEDDKDNLLKKQKDRYWADVNKSREVNNKRHNENKDEINKKRREERNNRIDEFREKERAYYARNKVQISASDAEYRRKNKDKIKASRDEWLAKNPNYHSDYNERNADKIRERAREYWKNNPEILIARKSLKRVQDNWRGGRVDAEQALRYSFSDLKSHIESLWLDGMSWDNRSEWHIDHIKPIKAFLDEGEHDPSVINALSNLQPLWAIDNLKKGAKWGG